ncbi:hypothetical protein KVD73_00990 [Helicobacter pylori]|nr:hypothetical protein KVD73_00990 [Helicobacter pylori]
MLNKLFDIKKVFSIFKFYPQHPIRTKTKFYLMMNWELIVEKNKDLKRREKCLTGEQIIVDIRLDNLIGSEKVGGIVEEFVKWIYAAAHQSVTLAEEYEARERAKE